MENITNSCICEEVIDEDNTEYIITQIFGWATGILALVKIFFFTITLLIKRYAGNISWIFVVIGIIGAICAIIFGVRINELSIYIRGAIMLLLSIIICISKIVFDYQLKEKKKLVNINLESNPESIIKELKLLLKNTKKNFKDLNYNNEKIKININKHEIIINSITLPYNKDNLKSLLQYFNRENLKLELKLIKIKK